MNFIRVVCESHELCKVAGEFYVSKEVGKFYELRRAVCKFCKLCEVLSHLF